MTCPCGECRGLGGSADVGPCSYCDGTGEVVDAFAYDGDVTREMPALTMSDLVAIGQVS